MKKVFCLQKGTNSKGSWMLVQQEIEGFLVSGFITTKHQEVADKFEPETEVEIPSQLESKIQWKS